MTLGVWGELWVLLKQFGLLLLRLMMLTTRALLEELHTPALPNHTSTLTVQETQPSRCWQNRKSLERTDGYAGNSVENQIAVLTVRAKAATHVVLSY